jgi:hypothetical protein
VRHREGKLIKVQHYHSHSSLWVHWNRDCICHGVRSKGEIITTEPGTICSLWYFRSVFCLLLIGSFCGLLEKQTPTQLAGATGHAGLHRRHLACRTRLLRHHCYRGKTVRIYKRRLVFQRVHYLLLHNCFEYGIVCCFANTVRSHA